MNGILELFQRLSWKYRRYRKYGHVDARIADPVQALTQAEQEDVGRRLKAIESEVEMRRLRQGKEHGGV